MSRFWLGLSLIGVLTMVNACIPTRPSIEPTASSATVENPSMSVAPSTRPETPIATTAVWQIAPSVTVVYDANSWKFDEAQNHLVWHESPECILAQNHGRGVPEDWQIVETVVMLGEHQAFRRTFIDSAERVQFVVYRLKGLEYLESEGILLLLPSTDWETCLAEAESLLAQVRATP